MELLLIIENIKNLKKDVQLRTNTYVYESDFTNIIDAQLNGYIKSIYIFCKLNNITELYNAIRDYFPIEGNAIEFFSFFDNVENNFIETQKYLEGIKRSKLVKSIGCELQRIMVRQDIDIFIGGYGIECSDKFYTTNSKRIYVQNVLANVDGSKIIEIAKALNLFEGRVIKTGIIDKVKNQFIDEQIEKCKEKITKEDFDGAITNARSLVEEILQELEERLIGTRQGYDGKIDSLYKRIRKQMNLDPDNDTINNSLNQIMRGFINIVDGMAAISNKMGDRHSRTKAPSKHHALLIVNSALVFSEFLIDTYNYQIEKGIILVEKGEFTEQLK